MARATSSIYILLVSFLFATHLCTGQGQRGGLPAGPFYVGYKTIHAVDGLRNYFGKGRPIQIYVWYPAVAGTGSEMRYGDYFDDIGKDWGLTADTAKLKEILTRDFKSGALNPSFPGTLTDEKVSSIFSTPIPVSRNAVPAPGKFPVLLHMHANGALTESIMLEYLTSRGYVVLSISMYGSSPAFYGRGEGTANELMNFADDLAFTLNEAKKFTQTDMNQTAMIGMLSHAALSLQSKNQSLKAIACLDCSWSPELQKKIPYFDTRAIRIPVMEMLNTDFADQATTFLDSLIYSDRFMVRFQSFPHADFYPFPRIAKPAESANYRNYALALQLTATFLDAVLKGDETARKYLSRLASGKNVVENVATLRIATALHAIPTEHEFLTWLRFGDMLKANTAWHQHGKDLASENNLFFVALFLAKDGEPHALDVFRLYIQAYPEPERNEMLYRTLGYSLIDRNFPLDALNVFQSWTKQFPDSPHSLIGQALATNKLKRKKEALAILENALTSVDRLNQSREEKERTKEAINEAIRNIKAGD